MLRLTVALLVGLLVLLPPAAEAGRVMTDQELDRVVGTQTQGQKCDPYPCAGQGNICWWDDAEELCTWIERQPGEHCVMPGMYVNCRDTETVNDCYRINTQPGDGEGAECDTICPKESGWTYGDWTGNREHDCLAW